MRQFAIGYSFAFVWLLVLGVNSGVVRAQPLGSPDRQQPGDEMVQNYLKRKTDEIHAGFLQNINTQQDWEQQRARLRQEYFYMLGLSPLPEKTPLKPVVTGALKGEGYVVEKLHYQSRPQLYVTGNLYRPAKIESGQKLPAVFYVCGHSGRGRNGNKTAFQSHDAKAEVPAWIHDAYQAGDTVYLCQPRGVGPSRWTKKNPPNYVERSHVLLGLTVDLGRVRDLAATARYLAAKHGQDATVHLVGHAGGGVLAAYAGLVEPEIAGVRVDSPPPSHMDSSAPQLLNVLRVCDIPEILGMIAPRPLTIRSGEKELGKAVAKTQAIYQAAGAREHFTVQ